MTLKLPAGVQVKASILERFDEILTHDALSLVAKLHRSFEGRRQELLRKRVERHNYKCERLLSIRKPCGFGKLLGNGCKKRHEFCAGINKYQCDRL